MSTVARMVTISVPPEYGYVIFSALSTFAVGTYLGIRVTLYRLKAKIPYPYEYASYEQVQTASPAASKSMLAFNAAQRSHQNFNENHVMAVTNILVAGLKYPVLTAALGVLWSINRILFMHGYVKTAETGGKGRYNGALWQLAHYSMLIMAGMSAWDILNA